MADEGNNRMDSNVENTQSDSSQHENSQLKAKASAAAQSGMDVNKSATNIVSGAESAGIVGGQTAVESQTNAAAQETTDENELLEQQLIEALQKAREALPPDTILTDERAEENIAILQQYGEYVIQRHQLEQEWEAKIAAAPAEQKAASA